MIKKKFPKPNKSFLFGLLFGWTIVAFGLFAGLIYFVFFYTKHPSPPKPDSYFVEVKEVQQIPELFKTAPQQQCAYNISLQSLALTTAVRPAMVANVDHFFNNCTEYQLSNNFRVIHWHDSYRSKLYLVHGLPSGQSVFYLILSDKPDYPSRSFTIKQIAADGKIYVEYGGWDYFGNNHSGNLLYELTIPLEDKI